MNKLKIPLNSQLYYFHSQIQIIVNFFLDYIYLELVEIKYKQYLSK